MSKYIQSIPHVDKDEFRTKDHLQIVNKKYLVINYSDDEDKESRLPSNLKEISINKRAFINQLDATIHYINYFVDYFDEDNELLASYMAIMFSISSKNVEMDIDSFVETLVLYLGSDSMIEKIAEMVDHNVDETMVDPPKAMLKAGRKKAEESIQLTLEHLKAILAISIVHRMCIPLISAYYQCRKENINMDEKNFYFRCFASMITLFDDHYEVNMYNKLYHTATTRVSKTEKREKSMWERRKRMGVTPDSYINKLMKDLFVDISQKTVFAKSAIKFIHVCFDQSIKNELIQQDNHEYTDMDMAHSNNDDDLTKFDKLQINNAKLNAKKLVRADAAISDLIRRLSKEHDVDLSDDVMEFYISNLNLSDTQINLVFIFFSSYVSYETMQYVKPKEFIKLIIIMKEILIQLNYIYMPHIITGRFDQTSSKRFNKKRLEKFITSHPDYESLMEEYQFSREILNKDKLYNQLRDCFQTLYVIDHLMPEKLEQGEYIDPSTNETIVIDEFIRLLKSI